MTKLPASTHTLAEAITRAASKQSYFTIRFLVDRELVNAAYMAYAYFRWLDDVLDEGKGDLREKLAFCQRQEDLLEVLYRGAVPGELSPEEHMLADLVSSDPRLGTGLQTYLQDMMAVMRFDARRRGRLVSQAELAEYTHLLASAVTEALYYFIGHATPPPRNQTRYLAVTAAHITHMLRDTYEDNRAGYYNIPREYLRAKGISPEAVDTQAYRGWVRSRVQLARRYFKAGRLCLAQTKNLRCRLACFAYTARFEWMLRLIECDNFRLRTAYPQRKGLKAGLWIGWSALISTFAPHG